MTGLRKALRDTPCKDALGLWGEMLWNKGFKYKGHYFSSPPLPGMTPASPFRHRHHLDLK